MGRIAQVRPKSPPKSKKIVDQVHEILLTLSRIEGAFEALFRSDEAKMVEQDIGLIAAVRAFNRGYTRTAGVVDGTLGPGALNPARGRGAVAPRGGGGGAAGGGPPGLRLGPAPLARGPPGVAVWPPPIWRGSCAALPAADCSRPHRIRATGAAGG